MDWSSWLVCSPSVAAPKFLIDTLHQENALSTTVVDHSTRLPYLLTPPHDDTLPSSGTDLTSIVNWNPPVVDHSTRLPHLPTPPHDDMLPSYQI